MKAVEVIPAGTGDLKRRSSLFKLSRQEIEATSQIEHSDQHNDAVILQFVTFFLFVVINLLIHCSLIDTFF